MFFISLAMTKESFKIEGIDNVLSMLKSMPPEVVSKSGGPVKLALKKGAYVIATQARLNVQKNTTVAGPEGEILSTGLLAENIIVSRGKGTGLGSSKGEVYLVRVRRKVYPGTRKKKVSTKQTARFLEYGTSTAPAEPFLRPAFEQKKKEAVEVVIQDLKDRIDKIAAKLLRQSKGK
jgi:HK97 gp10 family phage protein